MDAASEVFFAKGYQRATIEDIENSSGLTRGDIYYYFKGKEEIYISVLARGMRLLRDDFRWAARNNNLSPEQLILLLLDTYCDFHENHKEYLRILEHFYWGWEWQEEPREELVDEVNRLIFECLQVVVTVLNRGSESGVFSIENPSLEAILIWSMLGSALRKTTNNPRAAFLGIDWETMKAGLKKNILKSLRRDASAG